MKELTIEEKAQRYDEAIKVARQYYDDKVMPIGTNFKLEEMFPELKESKDEKIRKELIRAFKSFNSIKVWNGIERTDIIAWLEKQGKENPLKGTLGDVFDDLKFGLDPSPKQGEKKTAWSEDDENIIEWLIGYLEYQIMNATITEEKNNCLNAISMLKSLKDRCTWKPLETDIQILEAVIDSRVNPISYHTTLHSILEHLKKLREN